MNRGLFPQYFVTVLVELVLRFLALELRFKSRLPKGRVAPGVQMLARLLDVESVS